MDVNCVRGINDYIYEKSVMLPFQFSHSSSEAPGSFDCTLNAELGPGLEGNCS